MTFTAVADDCGRDRSTSSLLNCQKYLDAVTRMVLREQVMPVTVVDEFVGDLREWTKQLPVILSLDFDSVADNTARKTK